MEENTKELTGYPSIDKPWLKYYEEVHIDKSNQSNSIYINLVEENKENMDLCAISYFMRKYKFSELINKIDNIALSFLELGIKQGDIVTVALPNIPENIFCLYALNKIGAIVNFVDLRLKGDKLKYVIDSTNSKIIVFTDLFIQNLDEIVKETTAEMVIITSPYDSLPIVLKKVNELKNKKAKLINGKFLYWKEFENKGKNSDKTNPYIPSKEMPVCILYTSGTTGMPKGVVLTNENFIEMALQVKYSGLTYEKGDIFLSQVPPFLAYNTLSATNNPLTMGLQIRMLPDYQPSKFAENILKYKPQHAIAGPADWNNFLDNKKIKRKKFDFLVSMISGSDKIDGNQKEQINKLLKNAGCKSSILEGYGMTEIGAAAVMNLPQRNIPNSVGIPLRSVNVCIYDNDNDTEVKYGVEGEICLSGPTVMKEYYNNLKETQAIKRLHDDGCYWLHTGDVGYMTEDGNLYLKGRIKRLIVRFDGIKISPFDIEKIINSFDFIENSCVVGVTNPEKGYGSVPIANIVLKDVTNISFDECIEKINKKCRNELSEKYQPYKIIIRESLPLTDVGKIDYRKLEEACARDSK